MTLLNVTNSDFQTIYVFRELIRKLNGEYSLQMKACVTAAHTAQMKPCEEEAATKSSSFS